MNKTRLACIRMGSAALFLPLLVLAALPLTAAAACSGKYASMQSYAGKSIYATHFLDTPLVAARLAQLPGKTRLHLKRNLDVSGPLKRVDCHLVVTGNAPHMGTEQDAMLDVDLDSGTTIAAIHGGGRIDVYVLAEPAAGKPWPSLPRDVRAWAVKADMGFPAQAPPGLAQPGSVRLHALTASAVAATPAPSARSSAYPLKINFGKDAIKPTPAQAAAIRRAAAEDIKEFNHPENNDWNMAIADLNDDGRPDLLAQYTSDSSFCGSSGCSGVIVMATAHGYAGKAIDLPNFYGDIDILPTKHHGMHDLQFGGSPVWKWNGQEYDIDKADLPGSNASPWKTAQASGHPMMAYATPIDSTIKRLLLSCNQGRPLLTMLTKMSRPAGPVTLTFVFRGWAVNVPMQRNVYNANLWMADLARSDLPEWLAHRGNTPTTSELARLADMAFLRINGAMEGQISLTNSTAATRAALQSCYRY
ncbi:MAG TPA: hypothetical protein VFW60_04835 [Rhodanobacteraceae bacterium]|nr:hypothetical protein [Rhodanobacteraceae bacterium]